MTIAVIGADGRSGRIFVQKALKSGHKVIAGIYNNYANLEENENLEVMRCDATSRAQVQSLIKEADVIVSLIGHTKNSPPNMQTSATQTIVDSMQSCSVKRFISLTGSGVRMPGDKVTLMDKFFSTTIKLFDRKRVIDGINHLTVLQRSNLDWTVIRVIKLQNTKPRRFSLTENGPGKTFVSRYEVAEAILEIINNNTFIRKCPIITNDQRVEQD